MASAWYLFFTTFVSEDLAFVYGLFSVIDNKMPALFFLLFYGAGVILGDLGLYLIGVAGRNEVILNWIPYLKNYIEKVRTKNKKRVDFDHFDHFLAMTRFIPGSRIPTYVYCGLTQYSAIRFTLILSLSTFIYSLVGLSIISLAQVQTGNQIGFWHNLILVVSSALITTFIFKIIVKAMFFKKKINRVIHPLLMTIKRMFKPEFWPAWFIYPPLLPYFLYLFFRYRGFQSLFSANPAIHLGGMIGELKSEINDLIANYAPEQHLATLELSAQSPIARRNQIEQRGFKFPMVAKPDSGLRGTDVHVIDSFEELEEILEQSEKNFVVQNLHTGEYEWGVYYQRIPGQQKGQLFSITNKIKPFVTGDGQRSILDLVLAQPLLHDRLDLIIESNPELDFSEILPKEKNLKLIFQGSHSKGCLFFDGKEFLGTENEDAIVKVFDQFKGFYFGRIDIKFNNLEELSAGRFKILEINGVGAESTNIYDPNRSLLEMYWILAKQWRMACLIGYTNRIQGRDSQMGFWQLMDSIIHYRRVAS